jgi:molecular chaperone DnaK (HSP70)
MQSYAWFKLLLDSKQAKKLYDPCLSESEGGGVLTRPANKSAVDLCADYLTEVAKFAHQYLAKRLSIEVLEATPIEFHFTVPAVWSDRAKHDTLRAARKAARQAKLSGHSDSHIFLIREPEAAAIAVLATLVRDGSEQQLKVGESVLICKNSDMDLLTQSDTAIGDCGGGTVDITTYEITGTTPKLEFKERLVGTGMLCYLYNASITDICRRQVWLHLHRPRVHQVDEKQVRCSVH